jgi:hypothetical protein
MFDDISKIKIKTGSNIRSIVYYFLRDLFDYSFNGGGIKEIRLLLSSTKLFNRK